MSKTTGDLLPHDEVAAVRHIVDEARGYTINLKYLGIAFAGESIVILTSLYGAWLFAKMYGSGNDMAMHMMMLAPISYAVIEMSRVPLAVAFRTQPSVFIKVLAFIGVIAAAGVTIKSMSQLGEIMFRPRLIQVTETHHALKEATARRNAFQAEYATRKEQLDQATAALKTASETSVKQVEALREAAKPTMCSYTYRDRNGRQQRGTRPCPESAASKTIRNTMADQEGNVTAARERVDDANKSLQTLGTAEEVEANVVSAKKAYDNAVLHSQLHAFTGMFFGKDPAQVSEGELSGFLRIFVFVPAICVSLASTFLAMASVTKIKPKKNKTTTAAGATQTVIPVEGGRYVLDTFHNAVVDKTIDTVVDGVKKTPEATQPTAPNLKVA
ncbi:hypothetical protein [Microvirga tunisiensis]|uniref:DUF4407 domain-containing protein n=1 Tax=Microvirga tunisiensis TaxID=2108360 RepID=A0A5N7MTH9_9HYPH|nr:hypothetical protein [Microvirga tunisiensis]MPR11768.1 hypothetical protein [Microvirga tunisiensis]MPR29779.1 hypothetical protein [Microvirga tunisiensis]